MFNARAVGLDTRFAVRKGRIHSVTFRQWNEPARLVVAYDLQSDLLELLYSRAAKVCVLPAILPSVFLSIVFAGVHFFLWVNGVVVPRGCLGAAVRFQSEISAASMLAISLGMLVCSLLLVFKCGDRLHHPVGPPETPSHRLTAQHAARTNPSLPSTAPPSGPG